MAVAEDIAVAPIGIADRTDWDRLFAAYAHFYESPQTAEMRERVWGWLHDPAHELDGFIAKDGGGRGIGLAHYRPFARPLAASYGGFLDDLYVAPEWRGRSVAEALVAAVAAEGRKRGWSVVRWITAEGNVRARRFYDRVAEETAWVTYQIPLV
jgi:GNAT superfamily N-acetyltransferase